MEAVVVLGVLSIMMGIITWQVVANRRFLERRQQQQQAAWLARAGIEVAVARILADPANYAGETVELLPRSQVRITVERGQRALDTYRVKIEARYPTDVPAGVLRSAARQVRRVQEGGQVRVELTTADEPAEER